MTEDGGDPRIRAAAPTCHAMAYMASHPATLALLMQALVMHD